MPSYKLHYFENRGLASAARLMFHASGTKFEDVTFTQDQWPAIKPNSPTGKAPWLEVDGHLLVESFTINRFLADRLGFAGKDEFERATIDSTAEFFRDQTKEVYGYLFMVRGTREGDKDKVRNEQFLPALKIVLPYLEKVIQKSGSGFIAPSGVSWADFYVAEFLFNIKRYAPEDLKEYKFVEGYMNKVHSLPKVKEFVASRKDTPF